MDVTYDLNSDTLQTLTRRYERERGRDAVADAYGDAYDFAVDAWVDADASIGTDASAMMLETAQYADALADDLASAHAFIDASMRFNAQRDSAAGMTLR